MGNGEARLPRPLPLLGHAPYYLSDKLGFLTRCAAAGPAVEFQLGGKTYLLTSPADIKHVLVGNHPNYAKSARLTGDRGRRLFGPGLGWRTGEDHRRHRLMRQPEFSHAVIAGFADEVVERALVSPFMFYERIPTPTRRASRRVVGYLTTFLEGQIAARRVQPEHDLTQLVEARYEDGTAVPDEQLRDEVVSLAVTAREKVASALAWTLYLLARNPHAEQELIGELDAVFLGAGRPTASDLSRLPYAQMFVAESMRLYPPAWIMVRIARAADTLPSGTAIEAGAKVFVSQFVVHRDPRWFPSPEVFDPRRFETAGQARPKLAYLPFGSGPRVCIGEGLARMEAVLVLACVARRVKLAPVSTKPARLDPSLSLRPRGRLMMSVSPR